MLEKGVVMLVIQNDNMMNNIPFSIIHNVICEPHISVLIVAYCVLEMLMNL